MKLYVYIDNSNLFIEGQRLAAVKVGYATDIWDAMQRNVFDFRWNIDYGKLHSFFSDLGGELASVKLWGSIPPNDSFWKLVESKGFLVRTFERSPSGEKKVDTAIVHQITKDVYSGFIPKAESTIILVAGDKDFVPLIEDLTTEGYSIYIAFWNHCAKELKDKASYFINLDNQHEKLKGSGPTTS
jgi:hypothetical protein